ncbi:Uncharacterized protein YpuA, DUF1002 family [Desulfonispora thiosulfatigenes DSM 11270]|uniref:Uncharacterized protein YpuA, DUF1002 family n=1 Tax=Desulfonispora thiosulfatigenes DSM 11270 TaxID=656914 RepID=A0A1W1V1F8_DESTI|nr:DUF1002 domain-containing protein [Desulfonispora thiosulfatigenes]SMB87185.1 Uncharacterized protein YpuA, DUF1002 family [Desulfonispora thiosulfatigenes DSM 11270]
MKKKIMSILLLITLLIGTMPLAAFAGRTDVVSFGADLSSSQQAEMLEEFGVTRDEADIIEVTIQDVKDHLQGIATDKQIGTKAISSAYVRLLSDGEGIQVDTHNITWVSDEMYANAMATAGVEDAQVIVAAPFKVTGTTALTGIMEAFETASGKKITKEAKNAANEELIITGDMGKEIGKDEAVKLIQNVKEQIAKQDIKTPEDMRRVILDIAKELNIQLSDAQIDQILSLMKKISKLDLNVDKISQQLEKIGANLDVVKQTVADNKGVIQKFLDAISSFLRSIFG